MADGLVVNLSAQRNEDYLRTFRFKADGAPIDISGWTFAMRFNRSAGLSGPAALALSEVATPTGSVIAVENAVDGRISILISKEDITSLPGRATDITPFAYNLLVTDTGGIQRPDVRGFFIVEPGV
jgi:hypothetical protein